MIVFLNFRPIHLSFPSLDSSTQHSRTNWELFSLWKGPTVHKIIKRSITSRHQKNHIKNQTIVATSCELWPKYKPSFLFFLRWFCNFIKSLKTPSQVVVKVKPASLNGRKETGCFLNLIQHGPRPALNFQQWALSAVRFDLHLLFVHILLDDYPSLFFGRMWNNMEFCDIVNTPHTLLYYSWHTVKEINDTIQVTKVL